jgi:hypothetical protein
LRPVAPEQILRASRIRTDGDATGEDDVRIW